MRRRLLLELRVSLLRQFQQPKSLLEVAAVRRLMRLDRVKAAELFRDLAMARADGSHAKLLYRLGRVDVLVVDDWAMAPLAEGERRDFLEICDERYQTHSTLLTSQLPVASWHAQIGDPTVDDSIPDRLVHNAHRIELQRLTTSTY